MRARFLQLGLLNILSAAPNPTEEGRAALQKLYAHPLVQTWCGPESATSRQRTRRRRRRSSTPPSRPSGGAGRRTRPTCPRARLSPRSRTWPATRRVAGGGAPEEAEKAVARVKAASDELEQAIASIPNTAALGGAARRLSLGRERGLEVPARRGAVVRRRDGTRLRLVQAARPAVPLVIATVTVVVLNADTIAAGRVLWRDDAVRAAVVRQAEAAAQGGSARRSSRRRPGARPSPRLGAHDRRRADGDPERLFAILAKLFGLGADGRRGHARRAVLVRPAEQGHARPLDRRASAGDGLRSEGRGRAAARRSGSDAEVASTIRAWPRSSRSPMRSRSSCATATRSRSRASPT